jgi:hypothetical protein
MRPVQAACLLVLVAAACTRNDAKSTRDAAASAVPDAGPTGAATHPIARPPNAVAELGVLTDRPRAELEALIAPASLVQMLGARHCGSEKACDAVRAMIPDHERVEVTLSTAADWGIPKESTLDGIAKGLTVQQRATLGKLPTVIVVHVSGKTTPEHLVARAGFGLTAAIAERVDCSPQWARIIIHRFNADGIDGISWYPYRQVRNTPRKFESFFGCPVEFSALADQFILSNETLALPLVTEERHLLETLQPICDEAARERNTAHGTLRSSVENEGS